MIEAPGRRATCSIRERIGHRQKSGVGLAEIRKLHQHQPRTKVRDEARTAGASVGGRHGLEFERNDTTLLKLRVEERGY